MRKMSLIFQGCLGVAVMMLLSGAVQAQDAAANTQREQFSLRAPDGLHAMGLLQSQELILIEKACPSSTFDSGGSRSEYSWNTIEIGFSVAVPQKIPAESQFYTRYTCTKPPHRP